MTDKILAPGVAAQLLSPDEPVAYVGQLDGAMWFYFHAFGNHWEFSVAGTRGGAEAIRPEQGTTEHRPFYVRGYYGVQEGDADLMDTEQAEAIIVLCAEVWRCASDVRLQDID